MAEHLRAMGAPYGITFADFDRLSSSRQALLAAEFARDQGRFAEFHAAVFAAYFSQGVDIGSLDALADIAQETGVDPQGLAVAVRGGIYAERLAKAQEEAARLGVTGVPTFFIGQQRIVGAQPIEVFRKALRKGS